MKPSAPFPMIRSGNLIPFMTELGHRRIACEPLLRESWAPLHPQDYPDTPLPEMCLWNFIEQCGRKTGDRSFGFAVTEHFGLQGTGAVGLELVQQPSLGSSLELYVNGVSRHSSESRPSLVEDGNAVWLRRGSLPAKGFGFWQVEQYALGTILMIIRSYTGRRWRPRTIRVQAPASLSRGSLLDRACSKLEADCEFAEIEIPAKLLPRTPRAKFPVSSYPAPPFPTRFADALALVLTSYLGDYSITLELAARVLGLHQRTVKRRLMAEGSSFRSVRAQLLAEHACKRLLGSELSVAEIGGELGYTHSAHFCRAFKRQTGQSPGAYRAGARA